MRFVIVLMLASSVVVALVSSNSMSVAAAQQPQELPPLGAVVVEDSLAGTGPFRPRTCPTGRSTTAFAEGGLEMKFNGRCTETATGTGFGATATGLTATNGDFSIDAKLIEGYERGWLALSFREQTNGDLYVLYVMPSQRRIELRKSIGSIGVTVADRTDLDVMAPDTWARIGIRLEGQRFWVLINDEPILAATDPLLARGGFSIVTGRFGRPDDDAPVTAVWRNFRVTALANQPAASASQPPPSVGAAPFVPASGTPPVAGRVVHAESLAERGIIPTGACQNGNGRGEVVGEGFLLAVHGKCTDTSVTASVSPILTGLTVPDGEVKFEFKVTAGLDRTTVALGTRNASDEVGSYAFGVAPGRGVAYISKTEPRQPPTTLARRADLGGLLRRDDWNSMTVRLHGPSLWLLVNDQAVLTAENTAFESGRVWMGLTRLDNPDDEDEIAVVYRNIAIAAIDGAPDDRAPTYVRPPPGPPSTSSGLLWLGPRIHDGTRSQIARTFRWEPTTR